MGNKNSITNYLLNNEAALIALGVISEFCYVIPKNDVIQYSYSKEHNCITLTVKPVPKQIVDDIDDHGRLADLSNICIKDYMRKLNETGN